MDKEDMDENQPLSAKTLKVVKLNIPKGLGNKKSEQLRLDHLAGTDGFQNVAKHAD